MTYDWNSYGKDRLLSRNKLLLPHHRRAHEILLDRLAVIDTTTPVLDIGCGDGFYLEMLRDLGFTNSVGIDPSLSQVDKARLKNLAVSVGQIEDLDDVHHPLRQTQYGAILLWDLLEHLEHPEHALTLVYDMLLPNGTVFINTVVCDSVYNRVQRFVQHTSRLAQSTAIDPSHIQPLTLAMVRTMLHNAGLSVHVCCRIGNRWPLLSKWGWRAGSRMTVFGLFGDILTVVSKKKIT